MRNLGDGRRFRVLLWSARIGVVAGTLGLSAPVAAAPTREVNAYFGLRDRSQLAERVSERDIQLQPDLFKGKLVEVRGTVAGQIGSDSRSSIILSAGDGLPSTTVHLKPGNRFEDYPLLENGSAVRLLCQVVQDTNSTGSLEVVLAVAEQQASEVDATRKAEQDRIRAKQEAERRALEQRNRPRQLASRGSASAIRSFGKLSRQEVIDRYAGAVRHFNRRLNEDDSRTIAGLIVDYSLRYGLDARLVMAVIATESNFNASAVSPVGAMGLGQLMPGTASDLGVGDAFDQKQNLEGSTRLLSKHISNMKMGGRPPLEAIKLALACYNAGAGAVKKYQGIPPYRETQNYVKRITRLYWLMLPESERRGWNPD